MAYARILPFFLLMICLNGLFAQPSATSASAQVKITSMPFQVANSQHLNQIVWTMLGRKAEESIYCVSEAPVSQLRFICLDCNQKNVTDIFNLLNKAEDLTRNSGFPTVMLAKPEANPAWTGLTIVCQAAISGGTVDSAPSVLDVRYMRLVHVVDSNGQGPVLIANQGYHFYVECNRGADGSCQQTNRRKTLHCAAQSHPPATNFRWLRNGGEISGNTPEISIGAEMISQSIQCSANNGLFEEWPKSQAVVIDSYSAARLVSDNFAQLQGTSVFSSGNRVEINQKVLMNCLVEGNPRPVVFWKLQRANGQVVDAPCPQGLNGQYREVIAQPFQGPYAASLIRLNSICDLQISNYSFSGQYWCSACSYVSQGYPECAPSLENPGERVLNILVQGPPMQSETDPTVEQLEGRNTAFVFVHYCAEPAPRLPRDVVFSIDSNDIQQGQEWENFRFDGTSHNNTVPNCFFAKLRISPVKEEDQRRQIFLKVSNTYGSKKIEISLADLLGVDPSEIGGFPFWTLVLFSIIAAVLCLAATAVVYLKRNVLCGEAIKDTQVEYSNDKLKPNGHGGYSPDDSPRGGLFGSSANGMGGSDEVMRISSSSNTDVYVSKEAVV